jgi:hypothetical protein
MRISFLKSLVIGLIILFGANFYYVVNNIIPERVIPTLIVSNIFIGLYALFFALVSKKILSDKNNYFMIIFNAILSLLFLVFYREAQFYFQDQTFINFFLHLGYVSIMPYVCLIIFGISTYIPLILFLKKIQEKDVK